MITRNNNIYPFLYGRDQWGNPFARPRLVLKEGVLTAINYPVPNASQIFATTAVSNLPDIALDDYYRPYQWERGGLWYILERSYMFRFFYSMRPPSDDLEVARNLESMHLGQYVAQRLVQEVVKDGALPLVVYLPYKGELWSEDPQSALSVRMLQSAGIGYLDPSACLKEVEMSDAYMEGGHYSPKASAHIAQCLAPVLRNLLNDT
jgi:hypothetical protein